MIRRTAVWAAWAILLGCCTDAGGGDWPQFRGPTRQGISDEKALPLTWDAQAGENISWQKAIPGSGWSSPVVVGDRVYLTTAVALDEGDQPDRSLRALCLDAQDGKLIWNVEVFRQKGASTEPIHRKNSHASPTPVVDNGQLFVHFGTHGTACLDLDGQRIWENRELVYAPQHGNGGSPALVGDGLVISCDGRDVQYIVCLERLDGSIRWKVPRETYGADKKFAFNTPLAIEVDGRIQVVSTGAHSVSGFDVLSGEALWTVEHSGYSVVPRPVFAHGLVYVCTSFNTSVLLAIRPDGRGDVTDSHVEWRSANSVSHSPSPLIVGDELYMVSDAGIATCRDARNGEIHWRKRVGGNYSASPLFANGNIYVQNEQGQGVVFKAGKTYQEVARNSIGEPTLASYAASNGAMFVRSEKSLYRIESRD